METSEIVGAKARSAASASNAIYKRFASELDGENEKHKIDRDGGEASTTLSVQGSNSASKSSSQVLCNEDRGQTKTVTKKKRRAVCAHCQRPTPSACLCAALPSSSAERIRLQKCHCWVLEHPFERRFKNRSLPLVQLCLDDSKKCLTVVTGRRLFADRPQAQDLRRTNNDVWLLCPGEGAVSLMEALEMRRNNEKDEIGPLTLLFLDATWKYAKEMDRANLQHGLYPTNTLRVQLSEQDLQQLATPRRFDIRTPPSPQHLSTAECLAWVVSRVEEQPEIYDTLMKPLDLMVQQWHSFAAAAAAKQRGCNRETPDAQEKKQSRAS